MTMILDRQIVTWILTSVLNIVWIAEIQVLDSRSKNQLFYLYLLLFVFSISLTTFLFQTPIVMLSNSDEKTGQIWRRLRIAFQIIGIVLFIGFWLYSYANVGSRKTRDSLAFGCVLITELATIPPRFLFPIGDIP
jgi:uncharacterized BrkB/YihY/UPF0761 family membrane protein